MGVGVSDELQLTLLLFFHIYITYGGDHEALRAKGSFQGLTQSLQILLGLGRVALERPIRVVIARACRRSYGVLERRKPSEEYHCLHPLFVNCGKGS